MLCRRYTADWSGGEWVVEMDGLKGIFKSNL
jgi:hypothetical protein